VSAVDYLSYIIITAHNYCSATLGFRDSDYDSDLDSDSDSDLTIDLSCTSARCEPEAALPQMEWRILCSLSIASLEIIGLSTNFFSVNRM